MSRPRAHKLLRHTRGQAMQRLRCRDGRLVTVYLGPWGDGPDPAPAVLRRRDEVVSQWMLAGYRWPPEAGASAAELQNGAVFETGAGAVSDSALDGEPLVADLVVAFLEDARTRYRKGGRLTSQYAACRRACQLLLDQAAGVRAADYRPRDLKAYQALVLRAGIRIALERMPPAKRETADLAALAPSRATIRRYAGIVRCVFRFAAEEERLDAAVWQRLEAVRLAERGRVIDPALPTPREPGARGGPTDEHLALVMRQLSPQVRAMVTVQRLAGMRPQEVVAMRPEQLTPMPGRPGALVYIPTDEAHKLDHRGGATPIYLLEDAAAVVRPWIEAASRAGAAFVFRPAPRGESPRGARYTTGTYRQAVRRACERAGVPVFTPRGLRHTAATALVGVGEAGGGGLRDVQMALRHSRATTTAVYIDADENRRVAAFAAMAATAPTLRVEAAG